MRRVRVALFGLCTLTLLGVFSGDAFGVAINVLDPTGIIPPGPQQPYGAHDGCTTVTLTIFNYKSSGTVTHQPDAEVDDNQWYAMDSVDLYPNYYSVVAKANGGSPQATSYGPVVP